MKNIASIFLISLSFLAVAQKSSIYTNKKGAIEGYDPVTYFTKGDELINHEWSGATWYFSSEENKTAFESDPEKYAPQFGGYCAYAVSQGYTYKSSPEAWKVVDGKLYLNYSKGIQRKWEADQESFIKQANENWPTIIK